MYSEGIPWSSGTVDTGFFCSSSSSLLYTAANDQLKELRTKLCRGIYIRQGHGKLFSLCDM